MVYPQYYRKYGSGKRFFSVRQTERWTITSKGVKIQYRRVNALQYFPLNCELYNLYLVHLHLWILPHDLHLHDLRPHDLLYQNSCQDSSICSIQFCGEIFFKILESPNSYTYMNDDISN